MDTVLVAFGLGLPWLFGAVCLRAAFAGAGTPSALVLGYGYFLGLIVTTLSFRVGDAIGLSLSTSFWLTSVVLTVVSATGIWRTRTTSWRLVGDDWSSESSFEKAAMAVMASALLVRYAGMALEIAWQPLYAWDAWATWAPKARVWYELGTLVPFVDWGTWLERGPGEAYTIAGYYYPPTVPLTQVWMSHALGRWDESLMNFPALVCASALGLALYGQARAWGVGRLLAFTTVYVVLSLPLVNTHVALAGNADLWLAAFYGLAAMAFLQWCRTGDSRQGWLALGFAVACSQIKTPGLAWMLTFIPALVFFRARPSRVQLAVAAIVTVVVGVGAARALPHVAGIEIAFHPESAEAAVTSYFSLATWHLFFYVWPLVFAVSMGRVWRDRLARVVALLVVTGFAFLAAVYGFTSLARFAVDFTQLNRATLHMVPMLAFAALVTADAAYRAR